MTQVGSASKKCLICFIKLIPTYQFQSLLNHVRPLAALRRDGKMQTIVERNTILRHATLTGPITPLYCLNTQTLSTYFYVILI